MAIWAGIVTGLRAIAAPVTAYVEGRNQLKKIKTTGNYQIELAKIKAQIASIENSANRDLTYDLMALENQKTSWKDEYLTLVFTSPFILSFFSPFIDAIFGSDIQERIVLGWEAVSRAPDWYQWIVIGIVASVYGLRWLFQHANPLGRKKGTEVPK